MTEHITTILAGVTLVIDRDGRRTMLMLMPPSVGTVTYSINPNPALHAGLWIASTGLPLILDIRDVGDMVTKEWYATPSAGATILTWYEGHLHLD